MNPIDQPNTGPFVPGTPLAATAAGPQPGDPIGAYKLLQLLGQGGMGEVWMADQSRPMRRLVAIKLIQEGRDSKQVLARFEAERQALAMMDHANIAKVLDAGSTEFGRPYFVMELVKGMPITEYCDNEHLTPRQRIELLIPVCQAVQHAHQKGIIHRDLKPSNILVGLYDGKPVPKVIDFGVAKALHQRLTDRTMFTEVGSIIGTLEYMAPEQAELNNLDIDTRADVYALGVVLYELLAGSTPFTSMELRGAAYDEMLRMIREVEPPKPSTKLSSSKELRIIAVRRKLDPRRLANEIHGDLDWIVMKCLEKDRARRYDSANGLAEDLQRHLAHEPVLASPPGLSYRLRKWVRRKPATAALFGIAFLVPLLVAGLLGWHATRVEGMNAEIRERNDEVAREALAARAAESQERVQRDLAEERERNTLRHLYAANLGLFPRIWDSGRPIGLYDLLDGTRPERTGGQDLRGWEWFHLHHLVHPEALRFRGHATAIQMTAFSPDGSRIASTGMDGTILVVDSRTAREMQRIAVSESQVLCLAFHPDGRRLAVACQDATAGVIDLAGGSRRLRLDGHLLAVNHIVYSPDGRALATASADNTIKIWDARTGKNTATLIGHEAGVGRLWFDRDGKRLASIGGDLVVRFWNLADNKEDKSAALPIGASVCALDADFRRLAYLADRQRELRLVHVGQKDEVAFPGSDRPIRDVAFSADERFIATADADGDVQVWDLATGRLASRYRGWAETVDFSRDGDRVVCACADGYVKVWPSTDASRSTFQGHDGATRRVALNARGTVIATGDAVGSIRLWDARTNQHLQTLGVHIAERGPAGSPPSPALEAMKGRPLRNRVGFSTRGGKYGPNALREVFVFEGHAAEILGLTFSPDGMTLASAAGDTEVRLWHVESGKEIKSLPHPQRTSSVAFSPDGTRVVTGCWDDVVRIWNVQSGKEEMALSGHDDNVEAVLFHPSGKRVISAGLDQIIRIWDLTSRSVARELKGHTGAIHSLALAADGRTLASGSSDETVRVWDLQTGALRHVLQGHTGRITGLQFLPTHDRLISTSDSEADGRVRVWDLKTGREIVTLPAPTLFANGIAFDPIGQRLAVTSAREIVFWQATDAKLAAGPLPEPPAPKRRGDAVQLPPDSDPRVLGYMRMKELEKLHYPERRMKPERPDGEFLVVIMSVPFEHLYPTSRQHEFLQSKHRDDSDEKPAGPAKSYALHTPVRFSLVQADGKDRPAFAVAPFSFKASVGFNRGTTVESSTATLDPRDRSLMLVAFDVGSAESRGPYQVRFDRGEALDVPDLLLEQYRGNPTSGGTARRAGLKLSGTNVLREQRDYSDY